MTVFTSVSENSPDTTEVCTSTLSALELATAIAARSHAPSATNASRVGAAAVAVVAGTVQSSVSDHPEPFLPFVRRTRAQYRVPGCTFVRE